MFSILNLVLTSVRVLSIILNSSVCSIKVHSMCDEHTQYKDCDTFSYDIFFSDITHHHHRPPHAMHRPLISHTSITLITALFTHHSSLIPHHHFNFSCLFCNASTIYRTIDDTIMATHTLTCGNITSYFLTTL